MIAISIVYEQYHNASIVLYIIFILYIDKGELFEDANTQGVYIDVWL